VKYGGVPRKLIPFQICLLIAQTVNTVRPEIMSYYYTLTEISSYIIHCKPNYLFPNRSLLETSVQ